MNNTEPSVSDVAAFENDLKAHKVKVMLFNAQAKRTAVQRLVKLAETRKFPSSASPKRSRPARPIRMDAVSSSTLWTSIAGPTQ